MKKSIPYIILAVVAGAGVLAQNLFNSPPQVTPTATETQTLQPVTDTPTPTATVSASSFESCGYTWAYHSADELSARIDSGVRAIEPAASGRASFFGEDCVYADGHSTFSAMETDFYIRIPVDDLTDEDFLGNWMAQVLPLVVEIPREEMHGNYGFVEFWFERNDAEHVIARAPIQRYIDEAQGKTGGELLRMFYVAP